MNILTFEGKKWMNLTNFDWKYSFCPNKSRSLAPHHSDDTKEATDFFLPLIEIKQQI